MLRHVKQLKGTTMASKRFSLLVLLLTALPSIGHAVEPIFVAPKNFSNNIVEVTRLADSSIEVLLTRDDYALSLVSLQAEFLTPQTFAIVNGLQYREKIKVFDGKREVTIRHTMSADCVEESFEIVRRSGDIELIKSSRFALRSAKSIPKQNEKSLQKLTKYVLVRDGGDNNQMHKFHFQKTSDTISKESACTDDEINVIISNQE